MVFIEENGFIKALYPANDVYISCYNAEERSTVDTFINKDEIDKFKAFVKRVKPAISVEIFY